MTSRNVAGALLDKLNYLGGASAPATMPVGFTFDLDFDSSRVWPDLPFDTASPRSHYRPEERPLILQTLETAKSIFRERTPKAWVFVNEQLDRAMVRRSEAIVGASSSSNRELVGVCLLTNLHVAPDRVPICLEALVHEAIHQYLYRMEEDSGNFCDLGDPGRYRSPWSGNRIPLHSLIHASFVWFGLLGFWCQLAKSGPGRDDALDMRRRVAPTLFGFAFIREIIESPAFPRSSVHPQIAELIGRIAQIAALAGRPGDLRGRLCDSLRASENGAWVAQLSSGLEWIQSTGGLIGRSSL